MIQIKTNKILIDGFNLIYKFPELEAMMYQGNLPGAMRGLIGILAPYAKGAKKKLSVIFDGKKETGNDIERETSQGIQIFYSLDFTADYLIIQGIKHDKQPKMTTVVTSDNGIIGHLKKYQTPIIKSEDFAKFIDDFSKPEEIEPLEKDPNLTLSKEEVSFWEKIFKNGK